MMMESLCDQAEPDDRSLQLEIICVDDCSTDGSLDILKKWAHRDKRVKVYSLDSNSGQSVARNTALQHVTGDWLFFMDSDDMLGLDAMFNAFIYARDVHADMVMFDGDMVDEDNKIIRGDRYRRSPVFQSHRLYDGHETMDILLSTFTFRAVPWLYIVRTSYWRESQLLFPEGIIHEDEYFTACLTLGCKRIAMMHETLIEHRMRSSSTMGQRFSRRNMDCYLRVVAETVKWLAWHPEHLDVGRRYLRYTLTHVLITARSLPLRDRWHTLRQIKANHYLKYIETKRLFQFIIGKRPSADSGQSYLSALQSRP